MIGHYIVSSMATLVILPNNLAVRIDAGLTIEMTPCDPDFRRSCGDLVSSVRHRTIKSPITLCQIGDLAYQLYLHSFFNRTFVDHSRSDLLLDAFFDKIAETYPQQAIMQWLLSHRNDWNQVVTTGDWQGTRWDPELTARILR